MLGMQVILLINDTSPEASEALNGFGCWGVFVFVPMFLGYVPRT